MPGISVVIFLRPLNMLHYIIQGGGRGGRRTGSSNGLRQRVIVYILWNKADIASNVQGEIIVILELEFYKINPKTALWLGLGTVE